MHAGSRSMAQLLPYDSFANGADVCNGINLVSIMQYENWVPQFHPHFICIVDKNTLLFGKVIFFFFNFSS